MKYIFPISFLCGAIIGAARLVIANESVVASCCATIGVEDLMRAGRQSIIIDYREKADHVDNVIVGLGHSWDDIFDSLIRLYTGSETIFIRCETGCTKSVAAFFRLRREAPFLNVKIVRQ